MKEDWVECTLGEVCEFEGGGTPSKKEASYWNGKIPWASIKDIKGNFLEKTIDWITKEGLSNSSSKIAKKGELIIATRITPGKPIITRIDVAINQDLKIAKPKITFANAYIFWALKSLEKEILKLSSGTTVLGINLNNLKSIPSPLPPLPIQRALVAKIESLFSSIESGIADLKKAQAQLKIYRQAVLKKAFEGELTKAWREQQKDLPTAKELLAEIKAERLRLYEEQYADWEIEMAEWEEGGKVGKRPGRVKKGKELAALTEELSELPILPKNWKWLKLGNFVKEMCLGKMLDKNKNKGYLKPYLGNINVRWGAFDLKNLKEMRFENFENKKYSILKNDLIICEGGEPGRCAVWKLEAEIKFQKALHRVRFFQSISDSYYVY